MAKMYPERLPESILREPGRQAECNVYATLKTLPEKFTIYYSVHWETISTGGVREGEADFFIVHPDKGVVVLEVKGGGIRYDSSVDQWYSHSIGGNVYTIKDPVIQGSRTYHALEDQLKRFAAWPVEREINMGHAVCFPDTYTHGQTLKSDLPHELIIDRQDMLDITAAIERLYKALFGWKLTSNAPGQQLVRVIENYLANSFMLRTPLGVEIDYEDQKLVELTEQQFFALSILGDRHKVAIGGCAGSGKTMLAIEKARKFSELGLNVLLTCFNAPLAEYLKRRLPNIDVFHFHDLCRQGAKQVNIRLPSESVEGYYDSILPEALLNAASQIGRVYDAIIVDEGQDFKDAYWIALEAFLKENGYLFIFYDNNQNLYNGQSDFAGLITEPHFQLNRNCRNTQAIHNTVINFHNAPQSLTCDGPAGRPPEILTYRGETDGLRQLQKLLHQLVIDEHIHPSDIAILTPRGRDKTMLKPGLVLGNFKLSENLSVDRNVIQATSVFLFKGLERRVIIITEVDTRTTYNSDVLMYVGCSRARTHLLILHDVDAPPNLAARFQSGGGITS